MTESDWKILEYREVKKKHIPLLEREGLKGNYDEIIEILRKNPFEQVRHNETLQPKDKKIRSMRINGQHRVVFTIDKATRTVKIWAAWSHYEQNIPV